MDVASLIVKVQTQGVDAAQRELDKLSGMAGKAEKSVGGLASSFKALGAVATVGAVVSLGKEAVKMADSYKLVEARLSLVTKGTLELANAQQSLFNISQNTRQSFKETADLYTSLARSTQQLGKTQAETLRVTETINKAIIISGASSQSAQAALVQLGQGFASGTLRGEELNSVLEQTPRIAEAIAKGMGVTVGQLRALGAEGSLTGEAVFEALQKQAKAVDEEFSKIPPTVGQATTQIGNSLTLLAGTLDKATGATDALARSFSDLAKTISETALSMDVANKSVFSLKTADEFDKKTKLITDEINELKNALETDDGFLWFGLDERTTSEYQNRIKRLEQQLKQLGDTRAEVAKSLAPSLDDAMRAFQNAEKAYRSTFNPSKEEIEAEKKAAKERIAQAEKLAEQWARRKIEIATNIAIAEQDELAKPFIVLEAKYKEDLETFKSNKEAQIMLTAEYNAEVKRLQEDLTKKFNEEEEKKAKKSAEWQVKLLEANQKYNDEIIKMQDEMYGTDTSVDAWYNNQLEYLGKLSQEAGATAEELQTLLDKIETLKAMKLERQTISFKVEQSFYQSFEDNLADSVSNGFKSANLSSFFKNIGQDVLRTFGGGIANNFTTGLRTGSFSSGLSALGLGSASAVASDGSSILSDLSTLSTIKSLYGLATNGVSSTVLGGFNSIAGAFDAIGMTGVGNTIGQFGYGFANPFSANTSFGAIGTGSTIGGMALGGLGGYALGSLGDKLFGANTKAGSLGAVGGTIGSFFGPIGTVVGAALGSVIGGFFGSTKQTDAGLSFGSVTGMGQGFDDIQAYADMKKKSWFSSKSWTNYTELSASEVKQIKGIFDTYDFLLNQLGDTDRIILEAGKYTGQSFQDVVAKKFIEAFTDVSQTTDDTIYQAWVTYAESIDSTVIEALSASINTFITSTRTFDIWALNRSGHGIEALAQQAKWAQEDFSNLSNMLGVTGVTVENYTQMYKEAIKNSLTPETITQWQQLGTALMTATNAADAYQSGLNTQYQGVLASLSNVYSLNISIADLQIQKALIEKGISQDNLDLLNTQRTAIQDIITMAQNMRDRLLTSETITGAYASVLEGAMADFEAGNYGSANISRLSSIATTYADTLKTTSITEQDYKFGVLKIAGEIESITDGGRATLETVEDEIKRVSEALDSLKPSLKDQINALNAQKDVYVTQTEKQIAQFEALMGANSPLVQMLRVSLESAKTGSVAGATLLDSNISGTLADVASIYSKYDLHKYQTDTSGYEYWANQVSSGAIAPSQLESAIKNSAEQILGKPLGFANGGIVTSPTNAIIGEAGYPEAVIPLKDGAGLKVDMGGAFGVLEKRLARSEALQEKMAKDMAKMTRVFEMADDNGAIIVKVAV